MIRMTTVVCAFVCTFLSAASLADACGRSDNRYTAEETAYQSQFIPGGWRAQCRDVLLILGYLVATCPDQNGEWENSRPSFTHLGRCRSNIENVDGRLTCVWDETPDWDTSGTFGWGIPLWIEEKEPILGCGYDCNSPVLDGTVLTASCLQPPEEMENYATSTIDLSTCDANSRPRVVRKNGQLTCAAPASDAAPIESTATAEATAPVEAAYMTQEDMAGIPGSWSQSCADARWIGAVLHAACRGPDGSLQSTLDTNDCPTPFDIENINGQLTCNARIEVTAAPEADTCGGAYTAENASKVHCLTPEELSEIPGPWSESCKNAFVDTSWRNLAADCAAPDGAFIKTGIQLSECKKKGFGTFFNDQGYLQCR